MVQVISLIRAVIVGRPLSVFFAFELNAEWDSIHIQGLVALARFQMRFTRSQVGRRIWREMSEVKAMEFYHLVDFLVYIRRCRYLEL